MPIFEFKCCQCGEFIEFLFMKSDDPVEMRCPKCSSEDLERVLSRTSYSMSVSGAGGARAQTRTCSGGSCTTYDLPGPND